MNNSTNMFNKKDFTISYSDMELTKVQALTHINNLFSIFYNIKNIFAYEYVLIIADKKLNMFVFKDEPNIDKIIYTFNAYIKNNGNKIIKLIFS